ncbi:MAG: efflux RND transporter periplasmic adaptor subunit [Thermodesulfobacteriota bacterium]
MESLGRLFSKSLIGLLLFLSFIGAALAAEHEGVIEPFRVVKVGSAVPGTLETVEVDRGDFVKKGQILAKLQSGVEKATMEAARARAEMDASIRSRQAQLDFSIRKQQRNEQLYKKEALPLSQMDEVETSRVLAEMQLQEAIENKRLAELDYKRAVEVFNRMIIRSPISGVVVERYLSPGEYIEDQAILKLAQLDPLNVEVILPVHLLPSVKVGMKAKVIPEAPIGGQYVAQVKVVDRVIDAASGTFGVRLELPNPNLRLPAGLKCKVIFPEK